MVKKKRQQQKKTKDNIDPITANRDGIDVELESRYSEDNDIDIEQVEERQSDQIKKFKDKLKKCREEREEYLDGWQRSRAEFSNLKAGEEKRRQSSLHAVREDFITSLLPVLDSFSMAFSNKESWEKVDEEWRKGVEYIYDQFSQILQDHGIKEINDIDTLFDPQYHQSVDTKDTANKAQEGKVAEVLQRGYIIKMDLERETVVRPARVIVYKYNK